MFLLARAYEAAGDADNAAQWKGKVEKDYPNVDTSEKSDDESDDSEDYEDYDGYDEYDDSDNYYDDEYE